MFGPSRPVGTELRKVCLTLNKKFNLLSECSLIVIFLSVMGTGHRGVIKNDGLFSFMSFSLVFGYWSHPLLRLSYIKRCLFIVLMSLFLLVELFDEVIPCTFDIPVVIRNPVIRMVKVYLPLDLEF